MIRTPLAAPLKSAVCPTPGPVGEPFGPVVAGVVFEKVPRPPTMPAQCEPWPTLSFSSRFSRYTLGSPVKTPGVTCTFWMTLLFGITGGTV